MDKSSKHYPWKTIPTLIQQIFLDSDSSDHFFTIHYAVQVAPINELAASASLIGVTYRDSTYYGYIEEDVSWDAIIPGEWYKGSFKLLIESEVS